ncbi:hypothetical protein [Brevibacillus sp. AY1]|uniref:hypothetical protein n=1 Tax=Brevibacillus sp. AY1 TaxID=2807621 RepID=UPI0024578145|nr:hypothetical protein [Brevibacillus sp. AY1]MDH4618238.1 hypothetical protein [Brevibacillus sp. AY1]
MTRTWLGRTSLRKKRLWLPLLLTLLLIFLSVVAQRPTLTKATWIWDAQLIASQPEEIVAFAKQNQINLIYLQIKPVEISPRDYRTFNRLASRAGIKVEALSGDPNWVFTRNRDSIGDLIAWVKAFNNRAAEDERFQGIHVDIEPYLLPEWKKERDGVVLQWMKNMEYLVAETKKDTSLLVSADLPFWIDSVHVPGTQEPLSSWMLQRLDSITLMAYRNFADGPNGILSIVEKIVDDANDQKQRSVVVGVNILDSGEGAHVSFHERGTEEMMSELAILHRALADNPGYGGSAIHDYESWKQVSQREEKL